ncbi:MAG: hypothetical protein ACFFB5_14455 [Promethearchaeota archaeon]
MIKKEIFLIIFFSLLFSSLTSLMIAVSHPSREQNSRNNNKEYTLIIEGNHTYGGTRSDCGTSIIQTAGGGFAIAGYSESYSFNKKDFWFVRTDASGVILWNKTFGGEEDDVAHSIVSTSDGGFALVGYTESFGEGQDDMWLVKTDSDGNMEWNETYGDNGYQDASALIYTSDKGFLLTGSTRPSIANADYDMWIVKTDASGVAIWNKTYGGEKDDRATSAIQTSSGDFALAGTTQSFGAGYIDMWLLKINTSGGVLWNETYGGVEGDEAFELIQTSDGGYALTGYTISFGAGSSDIWLVKTNEAGLIQWNQTYGKSGIDMALSLLQTSDNGFAVVGAFNPGSGVCDMWFLKTDISGNIQFNVTFRGSHMTLIASMIQTSDGKYVLLGMITGWNDYGQLDDDLRIIIINLEVEDGSTSVSTSTDQTSTSSTPRTSSGLTFSTLLIAVLLFYRRKDGE